MAYPHTKEPFLIVASMPTNPQELQIYYDLSDPDSPVKMVGSDGVTYALPTRAAAISAHATVPTTSIYQFREAASGATDSITGGGWETVPLATAVHEGITGASIASNAVTLPAGTYLAEYFGQAYAPSVASGALTAQVRLYDGSAEVAGSGGSFAQGGDTIGAAATDVTAVSRGACVITLAEAGTIEMEIQTSIAATYGAASYASQVCAELKITRLS